MKKSKMFNKTLRNVLLGSILTLPFHGVAWGLADVESRSDGRNWSEPPQEQNASLDFLKKMEFLQQEVQELRGKVEEQNYQITQLQEQQKKLYLDLDQRIKSKSTSAQTETSGISLDEPSDTSAPASASAAPPPAAKSANSANEQQVYQDAYRAIQSKDYDNAIIGFESVINDHPQGKYAPNAYYWLGEIYVTKGKPDLAMHAFSQVYALFPKHPKSADALLKLGLLEYAKGNWQQSADHLSKVKTQFPGTTSAQLAETRLAKLKAEGKI